MVFGVAGSSVTVASDHKALSRPSGIDMAKMSSMSDSEIPAVIEEQARTKKEATRKFLDFCRTQGEVAGVPGGRAGWACQASACRMPIPLWMLSDPLLLCSPPAQHCRL